MNPVQSSSALSVQPDERLGDPSRFDYVAVVGGLIDEIERLHPEYVDFLRRSDLASMSLETSRKAARIAIETTLDEPA
jgi:transcriptional regulator GlxA family with amidase domain